MNTKKSEVSIIIPCYNVERYIESCLNSLKKQLHNIKYEIILIDDCSKDATVNIINKRIEKNDLKISLIKNDINIGAGASRNKALKEAKYEYISFIDADDFVDTNYYDILLGNISTSKADVVVCDINLEYEDTGNKKLYPGCIGEVNKINMINTAFAASPCNKIIKKELLIKYPFAEGIMNEDIASIISILSNSNNISYTNKTSYHYVQRLTSIQNSSLSDKRFDVFKSIEILEERIKNNSLYKDIMNIITYQQLFTFFIFVIAKETNVIKRLHYMRLFRKESKKYALDKNEFCIQNLSRRGKKARIYYSLIFNLNNKGFSIVSSFLIDLFNIYHKVNHSEFLAKRLSVLKNNITIDDLLEKAKRQSKLPEEKIKVSVVVPNYNYEKFLIERIYSILSQSYKIHELIILDDCSTDNSRKKIDDIQNKLKEFINIKKEYNRVNSGIPFKQWKKGFNLASGEYVWIAEADDYCEKNMLFEIMKRIEEDNSIVIGYVDTAFIDTLGVKRLKSIKKEIDIQKTGHWNSNYINDGKDEIQKYAYLNCTIANVSSCVIKKDNYNNYFDLSCELKQAGDWLLYINIMKSGKVLYVNKAINYYRVHGNNVTSTTKKEKHLEEIKQVYDNIRKDFQLNDKQERKIQNRIEFLKKVWNIK